MMVKAGNFVRLNFFQEKANNYICNKIKSKQCTH